MHMRNNSVCPSSLTRLRFLLSFSHFLFASPSSPSSFLSLTSSFAPSPNASPLLTLHTKHKHNTAFSKHLQSLTRSTNQISHATTHSSFHLRALHSPCSTFLSHLMSFTHTSSHHYLLPREYLPPTPFTLEGILGPPRRGYSTDSEVALHLCVAGVSSKIFLKIPSLANSPQPTTRTPMATFLRPHLPPPARSSKSTLNTHH